ncbi:putative dehydrogenase [Paraburkholderia sp. GAS41]|jgi:predicted dehydrogenase|uniref:hypothetical protein n=1 Tax=Paraburkholderia sp. GAS41 TaxID=3035134 RepID=UPI003D2607D3
MLAQQVDQVVVSGHRRRGNRSDLALLGQLIDDFKDAIALQNVVVLGDGIAALACAEAATRSARTGETVALTPEMLMAL